MTTPPDALLAAGFPTDEVTAWSGAAEPPLFGILDPDAAAHAAFWRRSAALIARLPPKPRRTAAEAAAATLIRQRDRAARERFLRAHAGAIYARLTADRARFLRVDALAWAAAESFPGLAPTRAEVAAERALRLRDKDGIEIDQGLLFNAILADEQAGRHLCHAMLLPHPGTEEHRARLAAGHAIDLGAARLERHGRAAHLLMSNPASLNAEDETTIDAVEIGIDLATLDPATDLAVLRGAPLDHPRYRGRRAFGSGINLTRLHQGRIPYLWFLQRELGWVHKLLRGVAHPDALPDDVHATGIEKPWVAAVETFAIGGHCQILLAIDFVIAASDAYMTLPARKEGIIPGLANLRLPRFTGERIARQAIQYERRLDCDSPEGRLICDEIVPPAEMDAAIARVTARLTDSGAVGAIGNRRAFRVGLEPLDLFRRACAVYAREQAYCYFSPALVENLERFWRARDRAAR